MKLISSRDALQPSPPVTLKCELGVDFEHQNKQ